MLLLMLMQKVVVAQVSEGVEVQVLQHLGVNGVGWRCLEGGLRQHSNNTQSVRYRTVIYIAAVYKNIILYSNNVVYQSKYDY